MKIENPLAFKFFLDDEIYLLEKEKSEFVNVEANLKTREEASPEFHYYGANKKNFLILVHYPDVEFLVEKHLTALENTVKRLGFELNDIAILNISRFSGAKYEHIVDFFEPEKILVLGKNAASESFLKMETNKIQQVKNIKLLCTFSFDEMMDSVDNKKVFWELVKQL